MVTDKKQPTVKTPAGGDQSIFCWLDWFGNTSNSVLNAVTNRDLPGLLEATNNDLWNDHESLSQKGHELPGIDICSGQ